MRNENFYLAAATVIPLLLIAIMATRSWRVGEMSSRPVTAVLMFGTPIVGEVAALSFLFWEPAPTAAASVLAFATWAGFLSQLLVAAWWLRDLVRPVATSAGQDGLATTAATPVIDGEASGGLEPQPTAVADSTTPTKATRANKVLGSSKLCPICGTAFVGDRQYCDKCLASGRS